MAHLQRIGSCDSIEVASRSSSDSATSRDNSTHSSTSNIAAVSSVTATGSTHHHHHQNNRANLSPPSTSAAPVVTRDPQKTKKFSLNLNGRLSPSSPDDIPEDSQEKMGPAQGSMHHGNRYVNKESLAKDLSLLSTMPELCDVTFLVGEDRQPVCGVRAILAARSRVFRKMLYTDTTAVVSKKVKKKQQQLYKTSEGYIEKYDFRGQPTVVVKDFEPEVFKQLVDYTHTGMVVLQARTLLGLMNAADYYGLEELKQACIRFMERCIALDSVCSLLGSAEKYIQYKSTKILVQKIFEFVDANAETVLTLSDFFCLPQHVVRIVLSREELRASETTKFEAAYNWCLNNSSEEDSDEELKQLFEPFIDKINYSLIPARLLMQRVKPSGVVDDSRILNALAFQADPSSVTSVTRGSVSGGGGVRNPHRVMTPVETSPRTGGNMGRFRRVQSSGLPMDSLIQRTQQQHEQPLRQYQRHSEHSLMSRDSRGASLPLDTREVGGEDTRSEGVDNDEVSTDGGEDGILFPSATSSEVHPLRTTQEVMRGHIMSQSSSHLSILSTPPLSPTHSPSTTSYHSSVLSVGSNSETNMTSPSTGGSSSSIPQQQQQLEQSDNGGSKKIPYNPQALDAIVNLSSSNAVEV